MFLALAAALVCTPVVKDGDTFRCGTETIRLLGIDTPELPGHCRPGRHCVSGDAIYATETLRAALNRGHLRIFRAGKDNYGRTLGAVRANLYDVSCYQLKMRTASYVAKWDKHKIVKNRCPRYVANAVQPDGVTASPGARE